MQFAVQTDLAEKVLLLHRDLESVGASPRTAQRRHPQNSQRSSPKGRVTGTEMNSDENSVVLGGRREVIIYLQVYDLQKIWRPYRILKFSEKEEGQAIRIRN